MVQVAEKGDDPARAVWPGLLAGALTAERLSAVAGRPPRTPLALAHAGQAGARTDKAILFLAEPGAPRPFAVVKWATGAGLAAQRRELDALAQMRALGDSRLAASCPPAWGPFPLPDGAAIALEAYVPGISMHAHLRTRLWPGRAARTHLRRCAAWYTRFATATRTDLGTFDDRMLDEHVAAPLATAAARFGGAAVPDAARDATVVAARRLLGRPVLACAEHGDLWAGNLVLGTRAVPLFVVDWEHFRRATLPGFDMLLFCTNYAADYPWLPFRWTTTAAAVSRVYVADSSLGRQIAAFLAAACAAGGLPGAFLPILLPVMMARVALRHADSCGDVAAATSGAWLAALRAWWARPPGGWLDRWAERA